jgi:hypothetical protein
MTQTTAPADPTTKAELLDRIREGYAALAAATDPLLPAQMTQPGVNGAWSVKDEIAHLTYWHHNLIARIQCATTGAVWSGTDLDDDAWNARCYAANRDRSLGDVLAELWRTQQAILEAAATLPDALLFQAGAHGVALWEAFDGSILGHYPEHIAHIERWRARYVTPPATTADLLYRIADAYGALTATLNAMPPRALILPGVNGAWSTKDEVAHLTFWEKRPLALLHAALADREPPHGPFVGDAAIIDGMNAECFAANRDRTIDDVLADLEATHAALVRAIDQLPEETLFTPGHYPWAQGLALWEAVAGNTYEHYPEHVRDIQRWRTLSA